MSSAASSRPSTAKKAAAKEAKYPNSEAMRAMTAADMSKNIKTTKQAFEVRKESRLMIMKMMEEMRNTSDPKSTLHILDTLVIPQFTGMKAHVDEMQDKHMTSEEMFAYYHTIAPAEIKDMLGMMQKLRADMVLKLEEAKTKNKN